MFSLSPVQQLSALAAVICWIGESSMLNSRKIQCSILYSQNILFFVLQEKNSRKSLRIWLRKGCKKKDTNIKYVSTYLTFWHFDIPAAPLHKKTDKTKKMKSLINVHYSLRKIKLHTHLFNHTVRRVLLDSDCHGDCNGFSLRLFPSGE